MLQNKRPNKRWLENVFNIRVTFKGNRSIFFFNFLIIQNKYSFLEVKILTNPFSNICPFNKENLIVRKDHIVLIACQN